MSAADVNQRVIDWLAAGDEVHPQECVKTLSRAVADLIAEPVERPMTDERLDELLARFDEPCEALLAAVFPLVEYAEVRAVRAVGRCVLHLAEHTAVASEERGWNARLGVVVLGRLIWAITTFAVHCGRWSAIAELSRVMVAVPHRERDVEPLIALHQLRYPEALGGNAGSSYGDYRQWLLHLELLPARYPMFEKHADAQFGEADLLLALKTSSERRRVYCESAEESTVRRFARDAVDSGNRRALVDLFQTTDALLDEKLEEAYARLEINQHRWNRPPATLLGSADD